MKTDHERIKDLENLMNQHQVKLELLLKGCLKLVDRVEENDDILAGMTDALVGVATVMGQHSSDLARLNGDDEKADEIQEKLLDMRAKLAEHKIED